MSGRCAYFLTSECIFLLKSMFLHDGTRPCSLLLSGWGKLLAAEFIRDSFVFECAIFGNW